jgi:hypothetical protein
MLSIQFIYSFRNGGLLLWHLIDLRSALLDHLDIFLYYLSLVPSLFAVVLMRCYVCNSSVTV